MLKKSLTAALIGGAVFILPATADAYTIQPGDTLSAIAAANGTTVEALASANDIANPNLIYAGAHLSISGGSSSGASSTSDLSSSTSDSSASNYAICHDGSLSDDVGQGCTNDGPYGGPPSSGSVSSSSSSVSSSSGPSSSGSSSTGSSGGSLSDVPGVPSSFAACVATRESSNGAGSSNVYGILGSGGQGSLAEQKQAFSQLYQQYGTSPWGPYDGC